MTGTVDLLFTSPRIRFSWSAGERPQTSAHDYLRARTFAIDSIDAVAVLGRARAGCSRPGLLAYAEKHLGLSAQDTADLLDQLIEAHLLLSQPLHACESPAMESWDAAGWSPSLYFHCTARTARTIEGLENAPETARYVTLRNYLQESKPDPFRCDNVGTPLTLPLPTELPPTLLSDALLTRRTVRSEKSRPVGLQELANLLAHTTARTRQLRLEVEATTNGEPTGVIDTFAPFEITVAASKVAGLPQGLYHYNMRDRSLEVVRLGEVDAAIQNLAIGQRAAPASVVILITCVFDRHSWRYRQPRAFRALMVNCARLAHSFILVATTMGFRTFLTPAIQDSVAAGLLGTRDYEEDCLYLVSIG